MLGIFVSGPILVMFLTAFCGGVMLCAKGKHLPGIFLFVLQALLLLAMAIPGFKSGRPIAQRNLCLAQVKMIDTAVMQWAAIHAATNGQAVDVAAVGSSLRGGALPACPAGGTYYLDVVGRPVTCTLKEHARETGH